MATKEKKVEEKTETEEKKVEEKTEKKVKTVKIKLPKVRGDDRPLFVSVNEYTCLIKRGEEVEVPWFIAECIENAERQQDAADDLISARRTG